ncbi:MAG: hypothetical protein M1826_004144 [Phylliscum demangeonii]|nr:MAG: hypothetical protein M1826_004144 [Phylliscum demangeonii]
MSCLPHYWVISTSNQKALVWNLAAKAPQNAIEHVLHGHARAITDINFSAHHPDILATCSVDSFVHGWDLRRPARPVMTFCDWFAGATQVKWNRQDSHIIASSHDKFLRIWDTRHGASPLRSIEAHDTKIYGIDWNRTRFSGIVTCSLDKSIKFWDYKASEDEPERVIRTPFPVWRARHTPFGWGLLAMPQRGDNDLHLYDRRLPDDVARDAIIPPAHRFVGHEDQVKEFLWRPRGGIVDDIDNREFQLVTWGADRDLRLHRLDDHILERVGYRRGTEIRKNLNVTRRNAVYRTFRDEKAVLLPGGVGETDIASRPLYDGDASSGLRGAISAGMRKAPIPLSKGWGNAIDLTSSTGMHVRPHALKKPNFITWMKGVKVGKKEPDNFSMELGIPFPGSRRNEPLESPESLGDEIMQVADRYKKVKYDHVDIHKRVATFSMNGPWGEDRQTVYIKVNVRFPTGYPTSLSPAFEVVRTSSLPQEILQEMCEGLEIIALSYLSRRQGCLEAVSSYLLGERSLEESKAPVLRDCFNRFVGPEDLAGPLSSDDEDNLDIGPLVRVQDLENSGTEVLGTIIANVNGKDPSLESERVRQDGQDQ